MKVFGFDVTNVTDDSRRVCSGSMYVAIRGANFDGESVAGEMLTKGAVCVMSERDLGLGEHGIIVANARLGYAQAVSEFYGKPTAKLKLLAVTGTNGKSTVATLIKTVIENSGRKCGFIGTTGIDTCSELVSGMGVVAHGLTTPKQDELYRLFAEMVENGAEFCVMETSSQALDQYRIADESFEVGVFTNLTQDHLDWHKTMENYYQAKKRLFTMCKSAVVCIDDEYGVRLAMEIATGNGTPKIPVITYSVSKSYTFNPACYYAVNVKPTSGSISYWLCDSGAEKSFQVKLPMPGVFNAANSIAAIVTAKIVGFDVQESIAALGNCNGVRGRCEVIRDGDFTVICDYAHTTDALEKILTCIKTFAKGRIICVFGAAGERDADKRPSMGATAAKHADFLVVTSDNPRFENPDRIIEQVVSGIPAEMPFKAFSDRREAIHFALGEAGKGDIILLAGKGHEICQVIGNEEQPFNEREIVNEFMGA
jgi:UDP-N-acetylmuramoyl-L-alanyl-D-glutamate--2,6-diaminopimelate ligase